MAACEALREGQKPRTELRPCDGCDSSVCGGPFRLPRQASSAVTVAPQPEMSSSTGSGSGSGKSATEARALKIHSEAERRRRERINAHLATLRRMIPDTKQMDKATLLARVVEQVKALKTNASEVTRTLPFPPESDEVSIECYTGGVSGAGKALYITASVSCADRPDLIAGIVRAFRGLRLRALRADTTSLGGRVRHVFTLLREEEDGSAGASIRSMEEAVRQALAKAASPETVYGSSPFQSKRQRMMESRCSVMPV